MSQSTDVTDLHSHTQFNQQVFLDVFQHCQENLPKVPLRVWFEIRMASHCQKTVALPQYFTPDQIMQCKDHYYLQLCATNGHLSCQL